jgi:hypothetical protein
MTIESAIRLLELVQGGVTTERLGRLRTCPESSEIVVCGDERTGQRFGQAACRAGHCMKIGSGGRNPGQRPYQLWAVW